MPSQKIGDLYFKVSISSVPTDYDKVGCDGIYVSKIERVYNSGNETDSFLKKLTDYQKGNAMACKQTGTTRRDHEIRREMTAAELAEEINVYTQKRKKIDRALMSLERQKTGIQQIIDTLKGY
jgi:hypothetical protein